MIQCASCGEENPERARFCLNCGSPLDAAASPRVFQALAHVEAKAGRSDAWHAALERALAEHQLKGNQVDARRVQEALERGFPGPG